MLPVPGMIIFIYGRHVIPSIIEYLTFIGLFEYIQLASIVLSVLAHPVQH